MLRRSPAPELLDARAYHNLDELRGNLRDMAQYDRWLGAFRLMLDLATRALVCAAPLTGLDIGVGSADFIAYARRRKPETFAWFGVDISLDVLRIAQAVAPAPLVCASGLHLPFSNDAFDVVTCGHVLHHLDPPQASALLRECNRVARRRIIIVDLARSHVTLAGAWLLTRMTSRNRLTCADGVLSARRAYTVNEVNRLVRDAGLEGVCVQAHGSTRLSIAVNR